MGIVGSATPTADIPVISSGLVSNVLAYYAWNILWPGVFVTVVGIWLNWRNSRLGYWLNLIVVGAIDVGLLLFLLLPGYMAWSDGGLGLGLWVVALIFSTLGIWRQPHMITEPVSAG